MPDDERASGPHRRPPPAPAGEAGPGPAALFLVSSGASDGDLEVGITVNGRRRVVGLDPRTTLLDALREHLGLTGSKKGCDHGARGACTVLVDGRRVNSCLTLAVTIDGAEVTTVEGLARGDDLHPLQEAFLRHDGSSAAIARRGSSARPSGCCPRRSRRRPARSASG